MWYFRRVIYSRTALLVGVVIDVAMFVALVDVGVVAVVGLHVDRGHGLEFLLLGYTYLWQTFFSKKKGLLTDIVNQQSQ